MKLIKDKRQAVFDKANATSKGRKLIGKIEMWKDGADNLLELQDEIRELAKECNLSVEDTKILAQIVCDKVAWSGYYKGKFMAIFTPRLKEPDYKKLATRALLHDPMKPLSDKELYEGDYDVFVPYEVLSPKNIIHMAKGEKGWYLKIRNGKPNNARLDTESEWIKAEEFEIDVQEPLEPQIN